MSATNENLKVLHFIKNMRMRQKLYQPLSRCGDGKNYTHSDYVYMRAPYQYSSGMLGFGNSSSFIQDVKKTEICNKMGLELPCIGIKRLNEIIEMDNQLLEDWIEEIQSVIDNRKGDDKYQAMKENSAINFNSQYNKDYTSSFRNDVQKALANYKGLTYKKESFQHRGDVPLRCDKNISLESYNAKYHQLLEQYSNNKDLGYKNPDYSYFPDVTSYIYSESAPLDNAQLQESRDLLKKILQQISSIEMKSQMNKTKIKTLVGQYGVLKKIRQSVDRRISAFQQRVDNLNQIRGKNEQEIEDLQSQIRRLKMSKENLKKEIKDIVRQSDISGREKTRKLNELNTVKAELEDENYKLKQGVSRLKNNRQMIERQNKKFQNDLKNAKSELTLTDTQLKKISSKLNTLNIDADKQKIDEKELLTPEELKTLNADFAPLPSLRSYKKSVAKKLSPKEKELEGDTKFIDLDETPTPPKRKRGRPRKSKGTKPKRKRKPRSVTVDDLFDDDTPSVRPKRKRGRPKKIKVKVSKRKKGKKGRKKKKDDDDDELIFNFSLRNFM